MKLYKYLSEESYFGNIGFEELVLFYQKASDREIEEMERVIKQKSWNRFKMLIKSVLGIKLV